MCSWGIVTTGDYHTDSYLKPSLALTKPYPHPYLTLLTLTPT